MEAQPRALKLSRRCLLLSPPVGLLAHFIFGDAADTAPLLHQLDQPTQVPFQYTAFIELNLSFILLAALGKKSSCHCVLANRVQRSSGVFLRLTQTRIKEELDLLRGRELLEADNADGPCACAETYEVSAEGRDYLKSCVEEWRLSQLATSCINTWRHEVTMSG